MTYSLNKVNFISNTFLSDQKYLTELIFDGKIFSYLPEDSSFSMTNSIVSSNSLLLCAYSAYLIDNNCGTVATLSTTIQAEKAYLVTFDYLSEVTFLNVVFMDNSLTHINYIKTLSLIVDGFICGNTQLSSSINDNSCLRITEFSKINCTIKNSQFFNKNLVNNYIIEASSEQNSLINTEYEGSITLKNITFHDITLTTTASFYISASLYLSSLQTLAISINQITFNQLFVTTPERLFTD